GKHPGVVRRTEARPLLAPVGVAERPPAEHQGDGQAGQELEKTLHGVPPSTLPASGISTVSPARMRAGPSRKRRPTAASPAQLRRSDRARSIHRRAAEGAWRSVAATEYRPRSRSSRAARRATGP